MTNFEKHIGEFIEYIEYIDDVVLEKIADGLRCDTCPAILKDRCSDTLNYRGSCDVIFTQWAKEEVKERLRKM